MRRMQCRTLLKIKQPIIQLVVQLGYRKSTLSSFLKRFQSPLKCACLLRLLTNLTPLKFRIESEKKIIRYYSGKWYYNSLIYQSPI